MASHPVSIHSRLVPAQRRIFAGACTTRATADTLTAARLFDMVKARGYTGAPDHFRHRIAQLRPRRPREAYLRLRTLAGEQAQVDWAHFYKLAIGRAERPLMAFVLVLSYSRYPFVRFYLNASLANLKREPTLELRGPTGDTAKLEPRGLWIIGGNGRIDLKRNGRRYLIVDMAGNFEAPDWKVAPAERRCDREAVTESWLRRVLR